MNKFVFLSCAIGTGTGGVSIWGGEFEDENHRRSPLGGVSFWSS